MTNLSCMAGLSVSLVSPWLSLHFKQQSPSPTRLVFPLSSQFISYVFLCLGHRGIEQSLPWTGGWMNTDMNTSVPIGFLVSFFLSISTSSSSYSHSSLFFSFSSFFVQVVFISSNTLNSSTKILIFLSGYLWNKTCGCEQKRNKRIPKATGLFFENVLPF